MLEINTREELARIMFSMLDPLKKHYSPNGAQLKLGHTSAHYPDEAAWMEGFSRPLWGLGSFWAGGGETPWWEDVYLRGIVSGTNPDNGEYWGDCVAYDQKFVEMAALSFSLLFAPGKLADRLTPGQLDNLLTWLAKINENPCCACNWRFFHVLVNVVLKRYGGRYDPEGMEESLDFLEQCYAGEGWYLDGVGGCADYYVPFDMHFYGVVYAMCMMQEDPVRSRRFLDRAVRFGRDFACWFDENGAGIPYGRSLTYRFAQASFYSVCVMAGIEPLPLGVMKGVIVRNLDYWMNMPIYDNAGILTIGYGYPNLTVSESYNAPGSPYWAMKLFVCLALPESDPFWSAHALPLPAMQPLNRYPEASMMIQRRPDGQAVMLPLGLQNGHVHKRMEEKYSKFAYSTRYAFSVMHSSMNLHEAAPDSVLAFEINGHIFHRGTISSGRMDNGELVSEWSPFAGVRVISRIIPEECGHRRIHIVESDYACAAYDAGFACAPGDGGCTVRCVGGGGEPMTIYTDPNTNLLLSRTVIPAVRYRIPEGVTRIETLVCY